MEAQEFKLYLRDNQYFPNLVNEFDTALQNQILGLIPSEDEQFTLLQSKRIAIRELLDLIEIDINVGNEASRELEGRPITGGIV